MAKPKYKHMSPYETLLWDEFLYLHGSNFDSFEYDIHVGQGMDTEHITDPAFKAAATILSQKRIDAVGHHAGSTWIFEVKPNAALSAVGQLISYPMLYNRMFGSADRITTAVVTDFTGPDEAYLFSALGIRVYNFPAVAKRFEIANISPT